MSSSLLLFLVLLVVSMTSVIGQTTQGSFVMYASGSTSCSSSNSAISSANNLNIVGSGPSTGCFPITGVTGFDSGLINCPSASGSAVCTLYFYEDAVCTLQSQVQYSIPFSTCTAVTVTATGNMYRYEIFNTPTSGVTVPSSSSSTAGGLMSTSSMSSSTAGSNGGNSTSNSAASPYHRTAQTTAAFYLIVLLVATLCLFI